MQFNQNYPWYMQQSESFSGLYNDLFAIVSEASPLDVYKMAYLDFMYGKGLLNLGTIWRITGDPRFVDAMIYDLDNWSEGKVWTGGLGEVNAEMFRKIIQAKIFMQGRQLCLSTLKSVFDMIFDGTGITVEVEESYMHFDINITGDSDAGRLFILLKSLDPVFLGALPGISYSYNYNLS